MELNQPSSCRNRGTTSATKPKANGSMTTTKRISKPRDPNESPARARKRALDREAQRTFREKTKNYITQLEKTVEACKAGSESQMVKQLLEQNAELCGTIERLRKIINDVWSVTSPEISNARATEVAKARCNAPPEYEPSAAGSLEQSSNAHSVVDDQEDEKAEDSLTTTTIEVALGSENTVLDATDVIAVPFLAESEDSWEAEVCHGMEDIQTCAHISLDTNSEREALEELSPMHASQVAAIECPNVCAETIWNCPPNEYRASNSPLPHDFHMALQAAMFSVCKFPFSMQAQALSNSPHEMSIGDMWNSTNSVYNQIFSISPAQAAAARQSEDRGEIFRAIRNGWDNLDPKTLQNPIMLILRAYDILISWKFDQVNRVAIAYKNHLLIKYYLSLDSEDLERMPYWQRPGTSQRSKKHDIIIDFFAWPALRERFISGDTHIESTTFSAAYIKYFRFLWPFSFEDTYHYDVTTDTYRANPLFERYHGDLRCWSMDKKFFSEFPQLAEDISSPDSYLSEDRPSPTSCVVSENKWYMELMDLMPNIA